MTPNPGSFGRRFGAALSILAGLLPAQAPPFVEPGPAFPASARPFAAFDADGDGDRDLLTSRGLLLNDGAGRFATLPGALPATIDPSKIRLAAAADMDNDGDQDLVVVWQPSAVFLLEVYLNGGGGVFGAGQWLAPGPTYYGNLSTPAALVVGDFDGDGLRDVAGSSNGFRVHRQTSLGVFVETTAAVLAAATPGQTPQLLAGGDFDADGLVEFVCDVAGAPALIRNTGGVWTSTPIGGAYIGVPRAAAVGDFDGDGRTDAVVSRDFTTFGAVDEFVYLPGSTPFVVGVPRTAAARLGALDANGDGRDDLLRCAAGVCAVLDAQTGASFPSPPVVDAPPSVPSYAFVAEIGARFVVFDADGDGDDDVAGSRGAEDYLLALLTTSGAFVARSADVPAAPTGVATFAADFDGDGDLDLLRPSGGASSLHALPNDGRGRFVPAPLPAPSGTSAASSVLTADFDADGDLDVFQFVDFATPTVHLQSAPGSFVAAGAGTVVFNAKGPGAVADFDADGDLDVMAFGVANAGFAPHGIYVFPNALGVFGQPTLVASVVGDRAVPLLADADTVPDFAVVRAASGSPPAYSLWIHSGATGAFLPFSGTVPAATGYLGAVAAGDLNGDGADDVVAEGTAWLGGAFAFAPIAAPPGAAFMPADRKRYVADANGDGVADVVEIAGGLGAVYLGQPGGGFGPAATFAAGVGVAREILADFDRDGDLDLFDRAGRPWTNATAGLGVGLPAFVGRMGVLDVFGPPGAGYDLFAATAAFVQTPMALPGWGNLWLVPAAATYVASGVVDADGSTELPIAVPNAPALVGLTLHWQAVLSAPARLTNSFATPILAP